MKHVQRYPGRTMRRRSWRRRPQASFGSQVAIASVLTGVVIFTSAPQLEAAWTLATRTPEQRLAAERSAYYRNCDAARAAGAAPIYRESPGYRSELDRDEDGIACEPYR